MNASVQVELFFVVVGGFVILIFNFVDLSNFINVILVLSNLRNEREPIK